MKLQKYISKRFSDIHEIDYVDLFMNGEFVGMYSASFALKGKYFALDPMEGEKNVSYCFPMDTMTEEDGGAIKFNYCGANFELTMFRAWSSDPQTN